MVNTQDLARSHGLSMAVYRDMWEMPEKRRDSQCVNGRKQCVFIGGITCMTLFKLAKGKIKVGIHVSVFTMKI